MNDLKLYVKTEQLLYKVYPMLVNYPKAKKFPRLLSNEEITKEKIEQIINSWYGHAKHANSQNFINKLLDTNDYIYQDDKGSLKVRKEVL